jgi:hypothetical protein
MVAALTGRELGRQVNRKRAQRVFASNGSSSSNSTMSVRSYGPRRAHTTAGRLPPERVPGWMPPIVK